MLTKNEITRWWLDRVDEANYSRDWQADIVCRGLLRDGQVNRFSFEEWQRRYELAQRIFKWTFED